MACHNPLAANRPNQADHCCPQLAPQNRNSRSGFVTTRRSPVLALRGLTPENPGSRLDVPLHAASLSRLIITLLLFRFSYSTPLDCRSSSVPRTFELWFPLRICHHTPPVAALRCLTPENQGSRLGFPTARCFPVAAVPRLTRAWVFPARAAPASQLFGIHT